jgi:hypothetical protein
MASSYRIVVVLLQGRSGELDPDMGTNFFACGVDTTKIIRHAPAI